MEEKEKELFSAMYSVEVLLYWAKIKMVILNFWGMPWWLVAVVQIHRTPISLHILNFPVRLTTSLVRRCLSIQQPHRAEAEERVAAFADGCGACLALLCKAGRCSHSVMPGARAAGPGHPSRKRWWQACRAWVIGAARAWLCFPQIGVSEHVTKSQLICSCLLWHRWYFFTCSYLYVKPVRLSS